MSCNGIRSIESYVMGIGCKGRSGWVSYLRGNSTMWEAILALGVKLNLISAIKIPKKLTCECITWKHLPILLYRLVVTAVNGRWIENGLIRKWKLTASYTCDFFISPVYRGLTVSDYREFRRLKCHYVTPNF